MVSRHRQKEHLEEFPCFSYTSLVTHGSFEANVIITLM